MIDLSKVSRTARYEFKHRYSGLCTTCPERAVVGRTRCQKHLQSKNETIKRIKLQRRVAGLCPTCGRRRHDELDAGFVTCNICRELRSRRT